MKIDDMDVVAQLVDITTGEILGWKLSGVSIEDSYDKYTCVVSLDYLKSVGSDLASYIMYVDAEQEEVVSCNKGYVPLYLTSGRQDKEYEGVEYTMVDQQTIAVQGYVTSKHNLMKIDDDFCISRAMGKVID